MTLNFIIGKAKYEKTVNCNILACIVDAILLKKGNCNGI